MSLLNVDSNSNHEPKQHEKGDNFGSKKIKNQYKKYLTVSYLIAVFMVSAAFATPLLIRKLDSTTIQNNIKQQQKKEEKIVSYAQLSPPPEIEQEVPEKEKPEPEPEEEEPEPKEIPKKEPKEKPVPEQQEKLVEPEVKKDENVEDEEASDLASQSEAKEAAKAESTTSATSESSSSEQKVFDFAEQKPTYPGGRKALMNHIRSNIEYPTEARKAGAQGQVVVQFVVDTDGNVGNIKVLKDVGYGTAEEARNLIRSLPKKFKPGVQNGKKVPVRMTLPIDFNLEVDTE